jgi:protein-tyrosine phosphatase
MEWDDRRSGIDTPHALWLPTIDGTPPTTEQLGQGAKFIHQQINARRGVYVHCAAGLGRSPTQVMAYFISQGMAIEDAIKWVKLRRPFITLSPRQIARLEEFQSYWKDGHH